MPQSVVVIIPPASPVLEPFARAILEGAADERGHVAGTIEVADPVGRVEPDSLAPLVFLGCCPEEKGSREASEAILSGLLAPGSAVREVARFDVHRVDADRADASAPAGGNVMDASGSRRASAPERFAVEVRSKMSRPTPEELARARTWSARVAGRNRAELTEGGVESRTGEPPLSRTNSVPWCGATD